MESRAPALDFLSRFRVERPDVEDFAVALNRPVRGLEPLLGLSFTGVVRAVPEGRVVFADEPLLEVTAPLPQAQLVETYLLNQVCHQTVVASRAARCVLAAAGHPVVDFSLRRTHGPRAGFQAARLGAVAGFAGTSNVAAATALDFPASGTMAHSYIEAFPGEEEGSRRTTWSAWTAASTPPPRSTWPSTWRRSVCGVCSADSQRKPLEPTRVRRDAPWRRTLLRRPVRSPGPHVGPTGTFGPVTHAGSVRRWRRGRPTIPGSHRHLLR